MQSLSIVDVVDEAGDGASGVGEIAILGGIDLLGFEGFHEALGHGVVVRTSRPAHAGLDAGLLQTPLVNHPEVAILSIGRIAERPVVRNGELAVAQTGYVSLTFDHRVVDGARAAEFGLAVIRRLEGT